MPVVYPIQSYSGRNHREKLLDNIPSTDSIFIIDRYGVVAVKGEWSSITYGNSIYVAVSRNGYVTTSNDAIEWSVPVKTHSMETVSWNNIKYSDNTFVASGEYDGVYGISFSKDGMVWSEFMKYSGNGRIGFGNNMWVVCGNYCIYTWDSKFTKKEQTEPSYDYSPVYYYDVAYGNDIFVLLSNTTTDGDVFTSVDGINWDRPRTVIASQCITFDGDRFIAAAGGGKTWMSNNGIDWSSGYRLPSNFNPHRIKSHGDIVVILGTLQRDWFTNKFMSVSTNRGVTWEDLFKADEYNIEDFCFIQTFHEHTIQ